ncbi:MAG: thiol oxidoreductase, partial [Myxococcales bacterium]|nr:thiol oxidoreductase [Myxococcales bacterium]
MSVAGVRALGPLLAASIWACAAVNPPPQAPGGATTVGLRPAPSLMRPAANLPAERRPDFHAGQALARQPWVKAPTATDARDGLGPVYNARACLQCHVNGGRGPMPAGDGPLPFTAVVRLSRPDGQPDATYGAQLQTRSVALRHQLDGALTPVDADPPPEARVEVQWATRDFTYPDGRRVTLRAPRLAVDALGYGPLQADTRASLRTAPPLHGMGLLALVPQAALEALADPDDGDGDGVSGRLSAVPDVEAGGQAPGRFGWKASQPTVRQQVAAALVEDMGIANPIFPRQPCTDRQPRCRAAPHGGGEDGLEISAPLLALLVEFANNLAVPARRKAKDARVRAGQALFAEVGCAACHHPRFVTGPSATDPHLAGQVIWPYTDLL